VRVQWKWDGDPEAEVIYEMFHMLIGWMEECRHLSNISPLYLVECSLFRCCYNNLLQADGLTLAHKLE